MTELGCIALQAVQKSHDGKDNHTGVYSSGVGFIVPLISGMFQVELTERHGYNSGLVAEYLISLCNE